MTYINRVGHISVPEDLWADMMQALQQLAAFQEWAEVLQRVHELDALHRRMNDAAARSTRDQIERGGDGQPYN